MRKEDKPNFIKEINIAVMEELTKGGVRDNAVGLAGEVKELTEIEQLCGLPFYGYAAKITTPRPRGEEDEVVVAFKEAAVDRGKTGDGLHLENYFTAGSRLLIAGKIQTLKDFSTGKVLVFVLADYVALSPKAMLQDDVVVRGELAYTPTHRETPRGKRISDIMVKVKSELTGGWCFIPCICWQETADEVATWQQGDVVELLGRYQSREYEKEVSPFYTDGKIAGGLTEKRTAYEISVSQINRTGEAENEE